MTEPQVDQIDRAIEEKRKKEILKSREECNHPNMIKGYYGNTHVNYNCLICGYSEPI